MGNAVKMRSAGNREEGVRLRAVEDGERFGFGENWARFLSVLNDDRIAVAEKSLQSMLGTERLDGKTFLDIGSGSGLFSLAARRLGARVVSVDYDPESVACTEELRRRYFPDDEAWTVGQGSVLDAAYIRGLGVFDIVYSWGVLHHTGAMWQALEHAGMAVVPGGLLFVSIYNDQGGWSRRWLAVKKLYNRLPRSLRQLYVVLVMIPREIKSFVAKLLQLQPLSYFHNIIHYADRSARGMSYWYDAVDWIGGYPFEVAKPEAIFDFYKSRGYDLVRMTTQGGGLGCNEFVFRRTGPGSY